MQLWDFEAAWSSGKETPFPGRSSAASIVAWKPSVQLPALLAYILSEIALALASILFRVFQMGRVV
jgi:hypothetical protein